MFVGRGLESSSIFQSLFSFNPRKHVLADNAPGVKSDGILGDHRSISVRIGGFERSQDDPFDFVGYWEARKTGK